MAIRRRIVLLTAVATTHAIMAGRKRDDIEDMGPWSCLELPEKSSVSKVAAPLRHTNSIVKDVSVCSGLQTDFYACCRSIGRLFGTFCSSYFTENK